MVATCAGIFAMANMSCTSHSTDSRDTTINTSNSFFPAAVGQYWVYAESTWINDSLTVTEESVVVAAKLADPVGRWSVLSSSLGSLDSMYFVRNDTVYGRHLSGDSLPFAWQEYIAIPNASDSYTVTLYGPLTATRVVSRVDSAINIHSHSFDSCLAYSNQIVGTERTAPEIHHHVIAPGVGLIVMEFERLPFPGNSTHVKKRKYLLRWGNNSHL